MGSSQDDLVGKTLADRYRVDAPLGEGAMGAVFRGTRLADNEPVALKVLFAKVAADDQALRRFHQEARISADLIHPGIVTVFELAYTGGGCPFIAMELLQGEDLATLLARQGALPLDRVGPIVLQLASALGAAHAKGVVHRDLKPPNVFVCQPDGGNECVKVLDFGVSKVEASPARDGPLGPGSRAIMTQTQATLGTPGYMSPEQAAGRSAAADARTDVFALGAICYELLAGRPPFADASVPALLFKILHQHPPPLASLCPTLPSGVVDVVERALEKDPEARFASMEAFARAFTGALEMAPGNEAHATSGTHNAHTSTSTGTVSAAAIVELERKAARQKLLLIASALAVIGAACAITVLAFGS